MDIWEHIEELKKDKHWTDLDVVRQLGKRSKSYLCNLRSGLARPHPKVAEKLANLLVTQNRIQPEQRREVILQLLGVAA